MPGAGLDATGDDLATTQLIVAEVDHGVFALIAGIQTG
jgi:hypothetical protein